MNAINKLSTRLGKHTSELQRVEGLFVSSSNRYCLSPLEFSEFNLKKCILIAYIGKVDLVCVSLCMVVLG